MKFIQGDSLCEWHDDDNQLLSRYCTYHEVSLTWLDVFILAVVVRMVCIPLDKISEWLVSRVLHFLKRRMTVSKQRSKDKPLKSTKTRDLGGQTLVQENGKLYRLPDMAEVVLGNKHLQRKHNSVHEKVATQSSSNVAAA